MLVDSQLAISRLRHVAVEINSASFELVKSIGVRHLYAKTFFKRDVFNLTYEILSQVGIVNNLVVVKGSKSQVSNNLAKVGGFGRISFFKEDFSRDHLHLPFKIILFRLYRGVCVLTFTRE